MGGVLHELGRGAGLHEAARLKHRRRVGEVAGRGQVVSDVEDGQAPFVTQLCQQVEDAGAQRGIQHRGGLVGHQHLGLTGQGPGDGHALTLPAGELVGVRPH